MQRVELIVHGVVQGVGFRYHTCQQALQMGLSGYVKNLADGTVEIVAEGDSQTLQSLVAWAQQGPTAARVTQVESAAKAATGEFDSFAIAH